MSELEELRAYEATHDLGSPSPLPLAAAARRALPASGRLRGKQVASRVLAGASRRKAARLPDSGLRLHLGCGGNHLDGWVNVDLVGGATDLVWDLRRPLPLPDAAADRVFLEHVFEHMTYSQVVEVLRHVRRVLRPGGVLRIGVPDAGLYARVYASDRPMLAVLRAGRPTPMLALREVFQEHGHLSAYDDETLVWVMRAAGFEDAVAVPGGTSGHWSDVPDSADRIAETVYAEATRT